MKAEVLYMDDNKIREEVIKHGVEIKNLKQKVDNLDVMKDAVVEISTTLKHMQEDNIKRDRFYKEQSDTLAELTSEMKTMNLKLDNTNKDLADLTEKVDDNISKGMININSVWKKIGVTSLTVAITGLVGWVLWKLGIKK